MYEKLILIGAGGYAKSVIDSLRLDEYEIVGFIDDIKRGTFRLQYIREFFR